MQTAPFLWRGLSLYPFHSHSHSSWAYKAWGDQDRHPWWKESSSQGHCLRTQSIYDSAEWCRAQVVARAHPPHKTHRWATSHLLEWLNQKYPPYQDWQTCRATGTLMNCWWGWKMREPLWNFDHFLWSFYHMTEQSYTPMHLPKEVKIYVPKFMFHQKNYTRMFIITKS